MPTSRKRSRKGKASAQAGRTQRAQREAEQRKSLTFGQYRRRRAAGWVLVSLAVLVGVSHWLTHLGVWGGFARQGVMDLVAGYPMALLLGIGGAITLSKV